MCVSPDVNNSHSPLSLSLSLLLSVCLPGTLCLSFALFYLYVMIWDSPFSSSSTSNCWPFIVGTQSSTHELEVIMVDTAAQHQVWYFHLDKMLCVSNVLEASLCPDLHTHMMWYYRQSMFSSVNRERTRESRDGNRITLHTWFVRKDTKPFRKKDGKLVTQVMSQANETHMYW